MFSIMRRRIAVGMLSLAVAGCTPSRSSMPGGASRGQPIGMDPVPSLNETINRGTGDLAIQQATLPDAKSPNWSGQFSPPRRGQAGNPPALNQVARSEGAEALAPAGDPAGHAWTLKSTGGALAREGDDVALVLPTTLEHAKTRVGCLHRNTAVLLGYVQNLITLTVTGIDPLHPVAPFRPLAVDVLNHLAARTDIPNAGVYKSRVSDVWIGHRGLATPIA